MIDWEHEKLLSLKEASRCIPGRNGKPLHIATLFRWITDGITCGNGRVKLESMKFGGSLRTSVEALRRFVDACSRGKADEAPVRSHSFEERAAVASARLEAMLGPDRSRHRRRMGN